MIHVKDDLYIDVDEQNYTLKVDKHVTKTDNKGNEMRIFDYVGYYTNLRGAILGAKEYLTKKLLIGTEQSLESALKCVRTISEEFEEVLDRVLGESR